MVRLYEPLGSQLFDRKGGGYQYCVSLHKPLGSKLTDRKRGGY